MLNCSLKRIEAWANGPVVRALYDRHAGKFEITKVAGGEAEKLEPTQRETVDIICETYGEKSSQYLRDLTHSERPWQEARRKAGLREGERGNAVISLASMADYYESLA